MLVVGLTGGIATGKSTVSSLLRDKHKLPIIDADVIAREVVVPGTPAYRKIVKLFGEEVEEEVDAEGTIRGAAKGLTDPLTLGTPKKKLKKNTILLSDGTIDRKKLGSIIFNDAAKRRQLNSIVHPAVRWAMLRELAKHWLKGERLLIMDVPLLIEGGLWRFVGKVIVVYCPADVQLARLIARDNSSEADASSRLNSQMPIAHKVPYADLVIDNSGSREELEARVLNAVEQLDPKRTLLGKIWWKITWLIPPVGFFSALATLLVRSKAKSNIKKEI